MKAKIIFNISFFGWEPGVSWGSNGSFGSARNMEDALQYAHEFANFTDPQPEDFVPVSYESVVLEGKVVYELRAEIDGVLKCGIEKEHNQMFKYLFKISEGKSL